MATLTNTKIKDTYDGLLKTTDNEALDVSGVTLIEDGLGNASALSVGRSGNGVTVTGNLAVDTNTLYVDAANNRVGIGTSSPAAKIHIASTGNSYEDTVIINSSSTSKLRVTNDSNSATNRMFITHNFSRSTGSFVADDSGVGTSSLAFNDGAITLNTDSAGSTAPTERMRIDSSGNVIVNSGVIQNGTTKIKSISPSAGSYDMAFETYSGGFYERMRIDSSGNVGIGTSSIDYKLEVQDNNSIIGQFSADDNASVYLGVGAETSGNATITAGSGQLNNVGLVFRTAATGAETERMRITSDGKFFIGKTSYANAGAGFMFEIDTNDGADLRLTRANNTNTQTHIRFFTNAGTGVGNISTTTSSTSYNTSSDYRLKENVVEMTGALDRVDALKPSRFNYILDAEKTVDGFLAHEVADIVPEAVTGEKDAVDEEGNPIYQGIDQSKIVPLLVGAIKELSAKVAALESQLNA